MNDRFNPPIQALPDGEAEVRLELHLPWEVVAALGQEAGRLAAQLGRPVSLDESVSHRLRNQFGPGAHAKHPQERSQPAAGAGHTPAPLAARSPGEQARQAIEKINGSTSSPHGSGTGSGSAETPAGPQPVPVRESAPADARGILERPTRATGTVNGTASEMPR
ncbi:hypothetical protein HUT19_38065 [Streptomyces sp. NA02950]|uniref:hypothetical protein n=1 Tax=Streptomyces sp. NA02950 TaxID=2742137 RepID=UPI001590159D|nr:hypothetical protein HUT19_38065 [Streptomyces sp. NA02950]